MTEILQLKLGVGRKEMSEVERSQVACRIVEKHVFRTGIGGIDTTILRTGVPFVDCRVVLRAWIGTDPGSPGDLVPEFAGLDGLSDFAVCAALHRPVSILLQSFEEAVRDPHAVVGILAGHGLVGFPIPVDVVFMEQEMREPFPRIGKHPLDVGLRH